MKIVVYVILAIISTSISDNGHASMVNAINNVNSATSAAEFQSGQMTYLIAGLIACAFYFMALIAIVRKIW